MAKEFMNTYTRIPVELSRGRGLRLYASDGKEYLDFGGGIAVSALGHSHPDLVRAIAEQAEKLIHTSNYYTSDTANSFAQDLVTACAPVGMEKVFLSNSGAEANEALIKIARKYSQDKYGLGRHRIITLKGSFHGRTLATLAATGQDKFHQNFGPFPEGFIYIESGDIAALQRAFDGTVCAVLLEPIQGESGVRPLSEAFVREAARLCAQEDVLLAFDEIQTGIGRTGSFLACERFGVEVDLISLAKGLAGGVPIGAVLASSRCANVLQPGDHGSTFGGNPLAAAAGRVVLNTVKSAAFMQEVQRKGELMRQLILDWKLPCIQEIRNQGLMIGVDITQKAWDIALAASKKGLLILTAGPHTLRFVPPLIIGDEEIREGLAILQSILKEGE